LEELVLENNLLNTQRVYSLCTLYTTYSFNTCKLDLPTNIAASRAVQLLSKIAVDVQGLVKRESGDLDGKGWRSLGVVEEGGRDEEKEGFDDVLTFLEACDTVIPTTRMRHRQRGSIAFYQEYE
jgi:hypothetical protein